LAGNSKEACSLAAAQLQPCSSLAITLPHFVDLGFFKQTYCRLSKIRSAAASTSVKCTCAWYPHPRFKYPNCASPIISPLPQHVFRRAADRAQTTAVAVAARRFEVTDWCSTSRFLIFEAADGSFNYSDIAAKEIGHRRRSPPGKSLTALAKHRSHATALPGRMRIHQGELNLVAKAKRRLTSEN
jgi:hypothetical protein